MACALHIRAATLMSTLDTKIGLITQYLDMRVAKHSVHASNIANTETPNWKALVPTFDAKLKTIMGADNKQWEVDMNIRRSNASPREDGNNVDLHQEMSAIADNSLKYTSAVRILTKEMAIAAYAVTSGR